MHFWVQTFTQPSFVCKELGYFSLRLPEPNSSFLNQISSGMVKSNYIKPVKKFSDVLPPLHHFRRACRNLAFSAQKISKCLAFRMKCQAFLKIIWATRNIWYFRQKIYREAGMWCANKLELPSKVVVFSICTRDIISGFSNDFEKCLAFHAKCQAFRYFLSWKR